MAAGLLIDTDILIDVAHEVGPAVERLEAAGAERNACTSIITRMELIVGCRNKAEFRELRIFLRRFEIVNLSADVATTAAELLERYRLSHGLLIPDALIAATALTEGMAFLTKNQRDFRFIDGLQLVADP